MFLDKDVVKSIDDAEYRHFMSLVYFAATNRSRSLKYNLLSKFFNYLFCGAFKESKECQFVASVKVYQFYACIKGRLKVAMYLIPVSDIDVGAYVQSALSPKGVDDLSYIIFYSINDACGREMILQEDFYNLFQRLRTIGELEDFVNDLERYKLTDS